MPLLILLLWPMSSVLPHALLTGVFILLGATDVLDGYFARRLCEVTKLGRALDPIADKFLVISCLLALLAVNAIGFWWVLIFVLREVFVMALRYIACEHGVTIEVCFISKLKTWLQLSLIVFVLMGWGTSSWLLAQTIYYSLLIATLSCSVYAAYTYYIICLEAIFKAYDF
jgi:CDP-diacylglycerol--glycerol-3-phosphate 3-phosphatidyltransferase